MRVLDSAGCVSNSVPVDIDQYASAGGLRINGVWGSCVCGNVLAL